jgi:hypothetical protein
MSYVNQYMSTRRRPAPMGGLLDTASKYINQGADIIKTGTTVLNDPALPQIIGMVVELNSLEKKAASSPSSGSTGQGIGLRKVVKPLELFVFYRKNEWILPVAIGGLIGLPFLLGYVVGKPGRGGSK